MVVIIEPHDWMLPGSATSRTFQRALLERDFELLISGENLVFVRVDATAGADQRRLVRSGWHEGAAARSGDPTAEFPHWWRGVGRRDRACVGTSRPHSPSAFASWWHEACVPLSPPPAAAQVLAGVLHRAVLSAPTPPGRRGGTRQRRSRPHRRRPSARRGEDPRPMAALDALTAAHGVRVVPRTAGCSSSTVERTWPATRLRWAAPCAPFAVHRRWRTRLRSAPPPSCERELPPRSRWTGDGARSRPDRSAPGPQIGVRSGQTTAPPPPASALPRQCGRTASAGSRRAARTAGETPASRPDGEGGGGAAGEGRRSGRRRASPGCGRRAR